MYFECYEIREFIGLKDKSKPSADQSETQKNHIEVNQKCLFKNIYYRKSRFVMRTNVIK